MLIVPFLAFWPVTGLIIESSESARHRLLSLMIRLHRCHQLWQLQLNQASLCSLHTQLTDSCADLYLIVRFTEMTPSSMDQKGLA